MIRTAPSRDALAATATEIVQVDEKIFHAGLLGQFNHIVTGAHMTNMLRNTAGHLAVINHDVVHVNYYQQRQGGHTTVGRTSLIHLQNSLIPLQTHTAPNRRDYMAYQLDPATQQRQTAGPLADHVLSKLPDDVLVTRVLGPDEAEKFARGDRTLGSSRRHLWSNVVHTALQNVTDEFAYSPEYSRVVGAVLPREELRGLAADGAVEVGTYDIIFKHRRPDSSLPFDAEVVFSEAAIPALLQGYQRWANEIGAPYLDAR